MKFTSKKWFKWTAGTILVVCGGLGIFYGDSLVQIVKLVTKLDLRKSEKELYTADRRENLRAIFNALKLYHENEGQFPAANGWMEAIRPQLRPTNMKEGEEMKKLKNPTIAGLGENEFGYSFNSALSAKNEADVPAKPSPILVRESSDDRKYNASGPVKVETSDALGINLAGEVVPLTGKM